MTLPPFQDQIPTGDTIPGSFNYYQFRVPNVDWIIKAILGQFLNQQNPDAWFQVGVITVDQAVEMATVAYESVKQVFPIGSIIAYASGLPATTDILPCNGASLLRADYPDLFAAIGTVWGASDLAHFNVPDLRGRVMVDAGLGPGLTNRVAGQTFGEETHQLTVAELASHDHAEGTTTPLPVVVVPADGVAAIGAAGTTGATGGDTPHNNMQPSAVCVYGIVAH